jgi:hypothetical protein
MNRFRFVLNCLSVSCPKLPQAQFEALVMENHKVDFAPHEMAINAQPSREFRLLSPVKLVCPSRLAYCLLTLETGGRYELLGR